MNININWCFVEGFILGVIVGIAIVYVAQAFVERIMP